jgi:hypothetical protein
MSSSSIERNHVIAFDSNVTIYARPGIAMAQLYDEVVMLQPETARYYSLNRVGARVWQLIQQPISLALLLERILLEYEVDRERLRRDMAKLIEDLCEANLVEMRSS